MRKLLTILFTSISVTCFSQKSYWVTSQTTIDGKYAYVSLPASYADSTPKHYPVIIFMPGNGEVGTSYSLLKTYGPHEFIVDQGWKGITNPATGDTIESIVISVQPSGQWVGESQVNEFVDSIMYSGRWRVDTFRVNVTGLSAGGWGWANHITNTHKGSKQITSFVGMHHPITDNGTGNAAKWGLMADYVRRGGRIWGFEDSTGDPRLMNTTRDSCNNAVAGSYRYTGRPTVTGGHCCWNNWYDPTYTESIGGNNTNIYQWMLSQAKAGANEYWGTPGTAAAYAGTDISYLKNQAGNGVTFTVNGTSSGTSGTVTYLWQKVGSEPSTTTITGSTDSTTTITGANVAGVYSYRLGITDGGGTVYDTIAITLRDLMTRNLRPCRVGTPQRRYLGDSLVSGRVTTTEIYLQHIERDGWLTNVLGGDTVVILKNPNDGSGYWRSISLGDISGNVGCPIVFVPDTSGITRVSANPSGTRGWYLGNADTNTMAYIKFDGGAWYNKTGIRQGFQANNSQYAYDSSDIITNSLNTGISVQLVHHAEFTGWLFNNTGHGIQIKKNSDSTKPFTIADNFRQTGNWIHHNYFYKTNYEGVYLGHTDPDGTVQAGNDGATLRMDSVIVENNVFHKIGLDGIQLANHPFSNVIARNNLVVQSGYRNQSSHRWSVFVGGNAKGLMYGNTIINARGPAGSLGNGEVRFYNNIIDSVDEGTNTESAMYVNSSNLYGGTDSLRMFIYDNIITRVGNTNNYSFVYVVNSASKMKKGAIRDNIFVHPTKTMISQMVVDNASDTVENNTIQAAINLDTCSLAGQDSYRVYKELMQTNAAGTPISFYDLEEEEPPVILIRQIPITPVRGRRVKF